MLHRMVTGLLLWHMDEETETTQEEVLKQVARLKDEPAPLKLRLKLAGDARGHARQIEATLASDLLEKLPEPKKET